MSKKNKTPTFFIFTFLIIIVNFIVKLLGLVNKIAITRVLGTSGMSLYVLSFPTIMLFISISGMSLYLTISKLVAEAMVNHKYSPKKILKKSIKLSLFVSSIVAILYIILLKPLTIYFLKNGKQFNRAILSNTSQSIFPHIVNNLLLTCNREFSFYLRQIFA